MNLPRHNFLNLRLQISENCGYYFSENREHAIISFASLLIPMLGLRAHTSPQLHIALCHRCGRRRGKHKPVVWTEWNSKVLSASHSVFYFKCGCV